MTEFPQISIEEALNMPAQRVLQFLYAKKENEGAKIDLETGKITWKTNNG